MVWLRRGREARGGGAAGQAAAEQSKAGPKDVNTVQGPLAITPTETELQLKKSVEERPLGANFRAVCWENLDDVQRWLTAVEEQVNDLDAAGRDRMRKKRRRVLSRQEARRQATAAVQSLGCLFAAAKARLSSSEPPPDPADPPQSERRPVPPMPGGEAG